MLKIVASQHRQLLLRSG